MIFLMFLQFLYFYICCIVYISIFLYFYISIFLYFCICIVYISIFLMILFQWEIYKCSNLLQKKCWIWFCLFMYWYPLISTHIVDSSKLCFTILKRKLEDRSYFLFSFFVPVAFSQSSEASWLKGQTLLIQSVSLYWLPDGQLPREFFSCFLSPRVATGPVDHWLFLKQLGMGQEIIRFGGMKYIVVICDIAIKHGRLWWVFPITLRWSNMAGWKMDHSSVIFLASNLHSVRGFSSHVTDDTRGYIPLNHH